MDAKGGDVIKSFMPVTKKHIKWAYPRNSDVDEVSPNTYKEGEDNEQNIKVTLPRRHQQWLTNTLLEKVVSKEKEMKEDGREEYHGKEPQSRKRGRVKGKVVRFSHKF